MSAQELADRSQEGRLQSQSREFKNVIWVALGNMPGGRAGPQGRLPTQEREAVTRAVAGMGPIRRAVERTPAFPGRFLGLPQAILP